MTHLLYFFYFLLKTNYKDLNIALDCAKNKVNKTKPQLILDMMGASLKYGSSFMDYFNFQFYRKTKIERAKYATMGDMYRFHKSMNSKSKIHKLDNKDEFAGNYKAYCNAPFIFSNDEKGIADFKSFLINSKNDSLLVFKDPESTAGRGVRVGKVKFMNDELYIDDTVFEDFIKTQFNSSSFLYAEDFIQQHSLINDISPTALNTIRVITLINNVGEVEIIGAVFRISVNSPIDNYSKGNIAAEVDVNTGEVITGAIKKNSSCDVYHDYHPITNAKIKGFVIPNWETVKNTVVEAAKIEPQIRTIGWDVAILENDVKLIEGNSQWNKDTWQIPAGIGKKHIIKDYL